MSVALVNGRVLGPEGWREGGVAITDGYIAATLAAGDGVSRGTRRVDVGGRMILPGFVDTQVNGGGGILFNDEPTCAGIEAIGLAHAAFGTTAFLPTLISDSPEVIERACDAVDAAIAGRVPGVIGIHVEGPVLADSRAGIHDPTRLRGLDAGLLEILCRPRRGVLLLTLAPERVLPDDLDRLREAGVVLSAGHTAASASEVETALRHGLSGFTHLYNAMTPTTAREPGVVGAALANEHSYCGLIVDGKHVDPRVLRQQPLHRGPPGRAQIGAWRAAQQADAARRRDRRAEAAAAVARRGCRQRPLDEHDMALAAQRLDQRGGDAAPHQHIVTADEADELAGHAVDEADQRNVRSAHLGDGAEHGPVIGRREEDGIRPLAEHLAQHRCLLRRVIGGCRNMPGQPRPSRRRGLLGAEQEGLVVRVHPVLREGRDVQGHGASPLRARA